MSETGQATVAPADRLLAAADLLDKRAGEAMPGPWVSNRADVYHPEPAPFPDDRTYVAKLTALTVPDATYIATMHPEVGKALAACLRSMATDFERDLIHDVTYVLGIADLLLAGES